MLMVGISTKTSVAATLIRSIVLKNNKKQGSSAYVEKVEIIQRTSTGGKTRVLI
jgi:hypothetical protein